MNNILLKKQKPDKEIKFKFKLYIYCFIAWKGMFILVYYSSSPLSIYLSCLLPLYIHILLSWVSLRKLFHRHPAHPHTSFHPPLRIQFIYMHIFVPFIRIFSQWNKNFCNILCSYKWMNEWQDIADVSGRRMIICCTTSYSLVFLQHNN